MKKTKKYISIFLIICTLSSIMQGITLADIGELISKPTYELASSVTVEDVLAGEATWADLYTGINEETVPEAVGIDRAYSQLHTERLYDEETGLNEVRFRNIDGSTTVYMFDYPVKYVNEYGTACDITLEIADTQTIQTPYSTSTGNAITTFSRNISDGISLTDDEVSITLLPILPTLSSSPLSMTASANNIATDSTVTRIDEKTVSYAYDNKTSIEYALTYTGFKEDIVVNEYTGQTEYEFTLETNGLFLTDKDGSFYLSDSNGNIKAMLGDIIIFTADEKNNTFGSMTAQTVSEGEQYLLTIHVDAEYLASEKTKYPIRIDPTIEINYDDYGSTAIADVTINSVDTISGTSTTLGVGKYGDDNSVSRVLMKFPGLDLSSVPSAACIQSAKVEIRDLMCQHEQLGVYCHAFTGNEWSEDTATWSNVSPDSYASAYSMNYVSYFDGIEQTTAHRYIFDISSAVTGWKAGYYSQNKGIIFKADAADEANTTHNYKTFASYNRSSNKPTFSMTYSDSWSSVLSDNTYYLNNELTGKYLWKNSSIAHTSSGLIADLGNTIQWEIINFTDGISIRSANDNTKYLGISSDMTSVQLYTVTDSVVPSLCRWSVELGSDGGCLIGYSDEAYGILYLCSNQNYLDLTTDPGDSGSNSYKACTWRVASIDYLGNTSSHTRGELSNGFSISCNNVDVGETITQIIAKQPSNAIWATKKDFTYSTTYNTILSIDEHTITGISAGYATITAIHKVTGLATSFSVNIFPGTFDVYIFASGMSIENTVAGSIAGHGWIEIISHSAHEYTIGHYQLSAGETVTIGRWGSQIDENIDGSFVGLWYNREIYEININNKYSSYVCSYETVNKSKLDQVGVLISSSYSGYNLATNNCVHFAISAWNICASSNNTISTSIIAPNSLVDEIKNLNSYSSGSTHSTPETIICGFYNGTQYIEHSIANY